MQKARLADIDCAKGIAIFAIVLVHANAVLPGSERLALGAAASSALAVFFLVSGFISRGRTDDAAPARVITRRVVTLMWLYVLWQPVVITQRIALATAEGRAIDLPGEVLRFLASPIRPNGELWYLWALALHLVLVAVSRRSPAWLVLVPAGTMFVVISTIGRQLVGEDTWHALGPGLQGLPQFAFFTILGSRLRILVPARRVSIVAVAASVLLVFLHVTQLGSWSPPIETALGVITVLGLAGLASRCRALAFLARVGRDSVAPYLMHMSVLTLLTALLSASAGPENGVDRVIARPLLLTGASIIAISIPVALLEAVRGTHADVLFTAPRSVVARWAQRLSGIGSRFVRGR